MSESKLDRVMIWFIVGTGITSVLFLILVAIALIFGFARFEVM